MTAKLLLTNVIFGQAGSDGVEIDDDVPVRKLKHMIIENESRKGREYPDWLLFLATGEEKRQRLAG
jgi:hypothetical protein